MNDAFPNLEKLKSNFLSWTESQKDIRAVIIVGSQARTDHPADKWGDLDLMIYTNNVGQYFRDKGWLNKTGDVLISFMHQTVAGQPELLVLFEGGYNVDFVFQPLSSLEELIELDVLPDTFKRGYKVILDKDGVAGRLKSSQSAPLKAHPPTEEMFLQIVNMYLYASLYVAKQLCRNERWLVKIRDANLKECLLNMIQWQAGVDSGWNIDVWHFGKFMHEWGDKKTMERLNKVYGHFDSHDSWDALFATNELFRSLSTYVGSELGFHYPKETDDAISKLILSYFHNT